MTFLRSFVMMTLVLAMSVSGMLSHASAQGHAGGAVAAATVVAEAARGHDGSHHGHADARSAEAGHEAGDHSGMHCCGMGGCGFTAPVEPELSILTVAKIVVPTVGDMVVSRIATPDYPPPRSVS